MSNHLLESLATTEPLAEVFSDASLLASMLQFEVALAVAEARCEIIPAPAAERIGAAASPAFFDAATIARTARASGTIAVPFVEALIERVRQVDPEASAFVHRGATSQDVTDTALVLCVRAALKLIGAEHERLAQRLRALSEAHAGTVMMGRTLLQPAPAITFGLKVAGWFAAVERSWTRLDAAAADALVLQFGGASGTLAALGSDGPRVAEALARELDLPNPGVPWHTQRDRLAALVAACGIYTAALGKIARDVALLMQCEVAEVSEAGGGSSTMPFKRNPARSAAVLAAATRLPALVAAFLAGMIDEHERGVGGWHAEAPTLVAAVQTTGAAVEAMADAIESLRVDERRMRANIASTRGSVFAERAMMLLAPALGREKAHAAIAAALDKAARGGGSFADALAADPTLSGVLADADRDALDTPSSYLGAAEVFRRSLLSASRK